jgi:hypothetical protein
MTANHQSRVLNTGNPEKNIGAIENTGVFVKNDKNVGSVLEDKAHGVVLPEPFVPEKRAYVFPD